MIEIPSNVVQLLCLLLLTSILTERWKAEDAALAKAKLQAAAVPAVPVNEVPTAHQVAQTATTSFETYLNQGKTLELTLTFKTEGTAAATPVLDQDMPLPDSRSAPPSALPGSPSPLSSSSSSPDPGMKEMPVPETLRLRYPILVTLPHPVESVPTPASFKLPLTGAIFMLLMGSMAFYKRYADNLAEEKECEDILFAY